MSWMAWTTPTMIFFIGIGMSLLLLTLAELKWPTVLAKGFLPLATTRGDRFFISLLSAAFIHLFWLALGARRCFARLSHCSGMGQLGYDKGLAAFYASFHSVLLDTIF